MTDQERLSLAEEASSLPIHVQMCAMRHQQVLSRIEEMDESSRAWRSRVEKAVWAILTIISGGGVFTASQVLPAIRAMAGQ